MEQQHQQQSQGKEFCQILRHPVLQHKLCQLRDKRTSPWMFRNLMEEVSQLMAFEVTRKLNLKSVDVETPMRATKGYKIGDRVVLVSIMRAGNGMLAGMQKFLSFASVGHIGIYRDKFIKSTVEYYLRLPKDIEGSRVILMDPMLATGDTAVASLARIKEFQVADIQFVTLIASRPGLEKVYAHHPDVQVFTLSIEPEMDENGFILPGIGDAGDRLYGTGDFI